jgi:hypothetical protein
MTIKLHMAVRLFREGVKAREVTARYRARFLTGFGLVVAVTQLEMDHFTVAFLLRGPGPDGLLSAKGQAEWLKLRDAGAAACRLGARGAPCALLLQPEAVERAAALLLPRAA